MSEPFWSREITQDGHYWYWDCDGWSICAVYEGYMHFADGSGLQCATAGLRVIGPLQEPSALT